MEKEKLEQCFTSAGWKMEDKIVPRKGQKTKKNNSCKVSAPNWPRGEKKRDDENIKKNVKLWVLPRDLIMANQKCDGKHCVPVSFHLALNKKIGHLI